MERRKFSGPIGEKIEENSNLVSIACMTLDLIPPVSNTYTKAYREFVELIVYCNEHKLYNVRDKILKKILAEL